jgi:hypothetical protein
MTLLYNELRKKNFFGPVWITTNKLLSSPSVLRSFATIPVFITNFGCYIFFHIFLLSYKLELILPFLFSYCYLFYVLLFIHFVIPFYVIIFAILYKSSVYIVESIWQRTWRKCTWWFLATNTFNDYAINIKIYTCILL